MVSVWKWVAIEELLRVRGPKSSKRKADITPRLVPDGTTRISPKPPAAKPNWER